MEATGSSTSSGLFDDADETIRAIHHGDVDALLVVSTAEGPQVFMLQGADEPYRVLTERMSDGAMTVGMDGTILYVDSRLSELTRHPAERLIGRNFATLFDGGAPSLAPEVSIEADLLRGDGKSLPVSIWSRLIHLGSTTATLVKLTDLSIIRRAEQLAAAERFARSVLEQATEAITGSLASFESAFTGRLRALALAQDILTQTHWAGTSLSELITAVLKPHRPADENRIRMNGPAVLLPARAMVPLSMTLHELTTNAIKYGALSTAAGRIDITWKLDQDLMVELFWRERGGGPRVERRARASSGFGTILTDRLISSDLSGSSSWISILSATDAFDLEFH